MTIQVPTSVGDLTVDQFQRIAATDDYLEHVAIACDISKETVRLMDLESLERVAEVLGKMNTSPDTFPLVQFVTLQGKEYGFHPNLSQISVGEYADLQTWCKDLTANLPQVLAILYRPIASKVKRYYTIEPYTAKEDPAPFRDLPMAVAYGAIGFFLTLSGTFVESSLHSLRAMEREMRFTPSGAGTPPSTTSPRETP